MKLGLTSLDLLALLKELKTVLISARIENVYQLEDGNLLIRFHSKSGQENLIVDPARHLNLTRVKYQIPDSPSAIASTLRRFLLSAKIDDMGQIDFDRIIFFELSHGDVKTKIIFELFGDGNVIIVDASGKIKFSLYQKEMKDRTIRGGVDYVPPPQRGHDISSPISIDEIHAQKFNIGRAITRTYNLPSEIVEEALVRSSIDPSSPASSLSDLKFKDFLGNARSIVEDVRNGVMHPNIVVKEGRNFTVLPIKFQSLGPEIKPIETFNEAVDEYFSSIRSEILDSMRRSPVEESLKNLEAILARQAIHVQTLEDERRENGEIGKLLMLNMKLVQSFIERIIIARRSGVGWDKIQGENYGVIVKSIDSNKGQATIVLGERAVPIDFKISATKNADFYFSKSKEAVKKLEGLAEATKETEAKISKLRAGLTEIKSPVILKSSKKEWYERFHWTMSSQNFLIIGGKDATQNEIIVKKHLGPKDIFAHADMPGGSVVVVKSEGKLIPPETKAEAVAFSLIFSKSWKSGIGVADGYWVNAEQVTKTPPSGEYLTKGAFMIYGDRNYLRNVPLELWFGISIKPEGFKIIVGNENYVKSNSATAIALRPGEFEGIKLISHIRETLAQRSSDDLSRTVRAIPNGEIDAVLPPGGSSVI